jgi:hypothetical protein
MKNNIAVVCFGLFFSFNLSASSAINLRHQQFINMQLGRFENDKNLNIFLMYNNKLLLQAQPNNQWSTLSSYCGEGVVVATLAVSLLECSQIAVSKMYKITDNSVDRVESKADIFIAQIESGTPCSLMSLSKNIKNKYVFYRDGWQSFEQSSLPDSYSNHQYLNKDLVISVMAAYKDGKCYEVSKAYYEEMP